MDENISNEVFLDIQTSFFDNESQWYASQES